MKLGFWFDFRLHLIALHFTPFHSVAPHCKLGEISLIVVGQAMISDIVGQIWPQKVINYAISMTP